MKKFVLTVTAILSLTGFALSQGCIVIRNISGFGQYNLTEKAFTTSEWQINIVNRYFKAFRDFKGKHDQHTPKENESVTRSFSSDISISRLLKNGWSIDFDLPISSNTRSTDLEHGGAGTPRHTTSTFGSGDLRVMVYKWLVRPSASQKGNIQLGLGLKLPTGDYRYQDYFYRNDTTKVLAPVNAAIQLGDGGTGIITELNSYYFFNNSISFYGNCYYMLNPRDQNGVSPLSGRTSTSLQIMTGLTENSVPDIYSFRVGFNFNLKKLSFSAGLHEDGEPVHDILGASNGFRRPGYNLSAEPGILYKFTRTSLYCYVPFIVDRKIKQAVPEANATKITGTYTIGQGGSGNYQVFAGVLFKI